MLPTTLSFAETFYTTSISIKESTLLTRVRTQSIRLLSNQLQVEKIDDAKKEELLKKLEDFRNDILEKSIAKEWLPRELQNLNISNLFNIKSWGEKCLFEKSSGNNKVYEIYESLYDHRNRCSHNTLSYQGDMIGPKKTKEIGGESYASWFTLLVLIDMIYRELYGEFSSKSH